MTDNNFIDITINVKGQKKPVKVSIEKGLSFENNGAKYLVDKDGKLHKFNKSTNVWDTAKAIEMTNYQYKAFQAISDNDSKEGLSKEDITKAMAQYSKSELTADLHKELPNGYAVEKHSTGNTNKLSNGVEIGIAYNDVHQASLKFEIADNTTIKQATQAAQSPQTNKTQQSKPTEQTATKSVLEKYFDNPQVPQVLKENLFQPISADGQYKNVEFIEPEIYTVKDGDAPEDIIKKYGIDFFEFFAANPDLKYKVIYSPTEQATIEMIGYIHEGDKLIIPGRYKIKPGSVKNIDDVVKATGVTKEYIQKVLMQMEPKVSGKPDLKAYYDNVNGKGVLTIGFGHTGRYLDKKPLTKNSTITEAQAYEIMAQDILNNKVRTIAYLEQNGISKQDFDKIPASLQSVIVDIPFNKGVFDGFENEYHDYTKQLKKDLNNKNYAMATIHTIRLSNVVGLEKRSMYRLICAMKDLKYTEKQIVKLNADKEMKRVIERLRKNNSSEANLLEKAWEKARSES